METPKKKETATGNGFWGKILFVDLSDGTCNYEHLEPEFYKKYLGGVGLAAKILWDNIGQGADPMGPDNILGFVPGLLTDTGSLFTGRFLVVGKSPQTGGWGDSNCGGFFSPALKRCGIDGVFIKGVSDKPVYLLLDKDKAEICDAVEAWGKDTTDTEEHFKDKHGKRAQVACIGPAGEKLSYMAGICNDGGRIAARSGLGAVMGSKKLKALVAVGKARIKVKDKPRMIALTKEFKSKFDKYQGIRRFLGDKMLGFNGWITRKGNIYPRQPAEVWRHLLAKFGTPSLTAMSAESGDSPIMNWAGVGYLDFPLRKSQKLGAEKVISYEQKKYGCFSCPLKCGGLVKVDHEKCKIEEMHKPEYETIGAFGSLLLNDDLISIFAMNDKVNRAGIDSISTGAVIGFAIECFERGLISTEDTGGLELRWGDGDAILKLTEQIINREGFGDILADGVRIAASKLGEKTEPYAIHCGGVEPPMHDPKFDPGYLTSYTCEPTPGRHTISSLQYCELQMLEKKFTRAPKPSLLTTSKQRYRGDDKGERLAVDSFYKMLVDSVGMCLFGTQIGANIPICRWINAATGFNLTNDSYLMIGERIEQLRHSFNVREGINPRKDFKPHRRLYGDPPQTKGPAKNLTLDLEGMNGSFYAAMRWNYENGKPEREHLVALGLDEVAGKLYPD